MRKAVSKYQQMISRRKFLSHAAMAAGGAAVTGYAFRSDITPFPAAFLIRDMQIPAPGGWRGKKALFISDIHYGNYFGPADAVALHALVRAENPDFILMGGDLGHTPTTDLSGLFAGGKISCPVFFSPGNHDVSRSHHHGSTIAQANEAGFKTLWNEEISWQGLSIIGFPSALKAPLNLELTERPGLKLVLLHEPDTWRWYKGKDVIQFSGHTHGGQIRLLNRAIRRPTLGTDYVLGEFADKNNKRLVVSGGIGYTAVPPRLNCPPDFVRVRFT